MAKLHLAILPVLILLLLTQCSADDPSAEYCNPNTVISPSSPVSTNIAHLLANIVQKFNLGETFLVPTYGNGESKVFGLAQCRADVGPKDCMACIRDAAQQVRKLCPNQSDARIWYDHCFLRYSQENFYGKVDTAPGELFANVENVTNPDNFNKVLAKLFNKIDSEAVKPGNKGSGKDQKKLTDFDTLYGLVQCTRDLAPVDCAQCLAIAIQTFEGFCSDKKGCRVLYSSCYVRYELYPFFFPFPSTKGDTLMKSAVIKQ